MNQLLLVEDEPLERQALKMELETGDYDISEIYEASNGQEALDLFEEKHPDILIVDINIPVLSGLDFIERIVNSEAESKILITTTYDRSRYVRTAISLGVTDYLLKPIDYAELKKAIEKCQLLLEEERRQERKFEQLYSYTQHHVLEDLLSEKLKGKEEELAEIMDIGKEEILCGSLVLCDLQTGHFEQEIKKLLISDFAVLNAYVDGIGVALIHPRNIFLKEQALARIRAYLAMLFKNLQLYGKVRMFCCEPTDCFKNLPEKYRTLKAQFEKDREKMCMLPVMPKGELCAGAEKQKLGQKWLNKLYQRDAESLIRSIKRRMSTEKAYWEGVDLFCEAFQKMDETVNLVEVFQCFEQEKPYDTLKLYLQNYYVGHRMEIKNQEESLMKERIRSVLQSGFTKDITQADVAEKLGMNPSYFSTIFKKEMGASFTEVLNTMRIEKAVELIRSGECNTSKIAEDSGFTNRKYFLQVFKKYMKQSVGEYMGDWQE